MFRLGRFSSFLFTLTTNKLQDLSIQHGAKTCILCGTYLIFCARSESPLGQNMLFCTERYRSTLNSILFSSFNIDYSYFNSTVDVAQLCRPPTASFLFEMIVMRDVMDKLSCM